MPNRPIISIEVNDQQFKDFAELFNTHQKKLDAVPKQWANIGEAADASSDAMAGAIATLSAGLLESGAHAHALTQHLRSAGEAQKQFGVASRQGASHLKSMAHDAKSLADRVFGIGKFLFKLGAVGGLGGVLGGFGLDKLANSAVSNQRGARGLGLTTGQYRAFGTDLGRYMDPSALENIANAKNSYIGRFWLERATGLSQTKVMSQDTGTLAGNLAMKAHDWWKSTPAAQRTDTNLQAAGFSELGMTMDDMRRLGASSRKELQSAQSNYAKDSKSLNLSDATVGGLYAFQRQLKLAGQALETSFSKHLSALGPSLGGLVTSLEKDAEILINGIFTRQNVAAIEGGIDSFVKYLGSQDFKNAVASFTTGLTSMAKLLNKIAPTVDRVKESVNVLMHPIDTVKSVGKDTWNLLEDKTAHLFGSDPQHMRNPGNLRSAYGVPTQNGFATFGDINDGYKAMAGLLASYPAKHHADTLASIIGTYAPAKDGNDDKNYVADVAKWTGFKPNEKLNLKDPAVLAKLMSAMVRQEHGWKVSPDEIRGDIAQSKWKGSPFMDPSIKQMLAQMTKPIQVNVVLTNKTGTNVAVSANAGRI